MGIKVRYRLDVTRPITVPSNLRHLFSRTEVPVGAYFYTLDQKQVGHEREIQELVRTSKGAVTARIDSTHVEEWQ